MQANDQLLQFSQLVYSDRDVGLSKYSQDLYDRVIACFNLMPIACLLNGKFFCVHGGISPELKTVSSG